MNASKTVVATILAGLALTASSAHAQELTIGAHMERQEIHQNRPETLRGFHIEAARARRRATLVVLFERASGTVTYSGALGGSSETNVLYTYGFGARWGGTYTGHRLMPFAEAFVGGISTSSQTALWSSGGARYVFDDGGTGGALMAQGTAGLLVHLGGRVDASMRADYRLMGNGFGGDAQPAASAGLRYRFK